MKTLTTERLILRLVSVDDAPFILELYNHPDFYRFVGDKQMRTDYEAARYIKENMLRMEEKKGVSLLVVEDKQTTQPLGICGLVKRDIERLRYRLWFSSCSLRPRFCYRSGKGSSRVCETRDAT